MTGEQWTCARCAAKNDGGAVSCASCGLLRGSVAPPPSAITPPPSTVTPSADAGPAPDAVVTSWAPPDGAAPEPPKRSLLSRLPIGLIAAVGIMAVVAIAGIVFAAGRSDEGDIVKSGDLAANELRVGDCFDLKDADAEEVDNVTAKPCTEAHEFEVVFTGDMPDGEYPTQTSFESYVADACLPAFQTYVGLPYEDSVLELFYFSPTDDAWGDGDHSIQCAAYDPDDAELTESIEGADR